MVTWKKINKIKKKIYKYRTVYQKMIRWIIFIKEILILLICPFCFNIRLNNSLQVRERSLVLLVPLKSPRNTAPMLS